MRTLSTCYEDIGIADPRQLGCCGVYCMKNSSGYALEESACLNSLVAVCEWNVLDIGGCSCILSFVLVARPKWGSMS